MRHTAPQYAQPRRILILPVGTPAKTIAEARAGGYLPVVTDTPEKVQVLHPAAPSNGAHDSYLSAMDALKGYGGTNAKAAYFDAFFARLEQRETAKTAPAPPTK